MCTEVCSGLHRTRRSPAIDAATLIGDLVASRSQPERRRTQQALVDVLDGVNRDLPALQPLAPTLGDEFQGLYASIGPAIVAGLLFRLLLRASVDCRIGLGWGAVEVYDASPPLVSQDGPAWWAARDAIDAVKQRAAQRRYRDLRTWIGPDYGGGLDLMTLRAFLLARDAAVAGLGARGDRLLDGLIVGRSQAELAAAEGTSRSAVTQYLGRHGLVLLAEAHRELIAQSTGGQSTGGDG